MTMPGWDWKAAARSVGARGDGRFNAGLVELPTRALVWWRGDGTVTELTGQQVDRLVNEIAALLVELGVRRGDRVACLVGRRPESFAVALATLRIGGIYVPLFSGFGGDALRLRLEDSAPAVIVTDVANRAALGGVQDAVVGLRVVVAGGPGEDGDLPLGAALGKPRAAPAVAETALDDTAIIMYTSGTTGRPKGCEIPHRAIVNLLPYVRHCLSVGEGDLLFSGADAGWSFGLLTTGLAPMSLGATRLIYEGAFDPRGWWECVRATRPTHLAAAPTAFRQLAAAGPGIVPPGVPDMTSAGEPLDAATFEWFDKATGVAVHDSYGLSELGMVIANLRGPTVRRAEPGSMGLPLPGFDVRLLDVDGRPVQGEGEGRIAVRDNGFFLSGGYWGRKQDWDDRFEDGWFVTEDVARRDALGQFHYVGRADDVIVTSGYNVGPVEVETALISHPLVTDAACVGEPDPMKGQIVVAYVVLAETADPPTDLLREIRAWVGGRVGWHAAPRRVEVRAALPRTDSGKVQRRLLRATSATQLDPVAE